MMEEDMGASVPDRAGALRAEPAAQSQAKPLIPCAVSVVIRRTGDYEYTEETLCAFLTKDAAALFVERAEREWREAVERVPDHIGYPDDNDDDAGWARWRRRRLRTWKRFRAILTADPNAAPENEWSGPDEPTYFYVTVPLYATEGIAQNQSRGK